MKNAAKKTTFVNAKTVKSALQHMYGSAGHLLKIWFALKHMGLAPNSPAVAIDTSNSTPSLERLFSCGDPDRRFFIPFAHTPRYLTMKHDAARSIVQTTIQRWATSGSVVTCDPTDFLNMTNQDGELRVATARRYPFGLGVGESGFALEDGTRVAIPITSFAIWFGRQTAIPGGQEAAAFLTKTMLEELHISPSEKELIFVDDELEIQTQPSSLTDRQILTICLPFIDGQEEVTATVHREEFINYARRVTSMTSGLNQPEWMRIAPEEEFRQLVEDGAKCILLYGPPRTGKTRAIDATISPTSEARCTIQIHEGWGYDHLIQGLQPDAEGNWSWTPGPLKEAIANGKKYIVLEEINRTSISQALGEVFSLIEDAYRGQGHAITLRSGESFFIPADVTFLMTMNTVDKSTQDVDDALIGRLAAVEFPPRTEDLAEMLDSHDVPKKTAEKLTQMFAAILDVYPLGHGYFVGLKGEIDDQTVVRYYKSRIRPVLFNFLGALKSNELARIDNIVDEMFGKA